MSRKNISISDSIDRLKEAIGLKKDVEVALLMGVKQNTVSGWRKRNTIDLHLLIEICDNHELSLDWVLTGDGSLRKIVDASPALLANTINSKYGDLPSLLGMTANVLQSGTDYAESLAANIKSFHKSVEMERRLLGHENSMAKNHTEARLDRLEKMFTEIDSKIENVITGEGQRRSDQSDLSATGTDGASVGAPENHEKKR